MPEIRSNHEWLTALTASGNTQETAIADLRNILLRAALFYFSRNQGDFGRSEVLQRAEDCAQDALIAVMSHLEDFRGDSKFSTWAYKFAINIALMSSRRERWKGASLDELSESGKEAYLKWILRDKAVGFSPEQEAMQSELRRVIQNVIDHQITEKQRQVLLLMVFNEVPMDEVVLLLDSNRNAVYKLLHDARRKIKAELQSHGFEIGDSLALFDARQ